MNQEIEVIKNNSNLVCWSPKEVIAQIQAIQQLMRDGMKEGEEWGKIPGCGDKPALLKPGAEKLGLMFRLAGKYEIIEVNLSNGHLDVKVKCSLYHIVTGSFWGEGLGSCSTMETKYRYRSGVGESTGIKVPKEYWDLRKSDPTKAQEIIGGKGYATKKDDVTGMWYIYERIEKTENPDIADTYNTVRKIAKKRAFVDAMLSATAASDIFTQDIDEMFGIAETADQKEKKEAIAIQETTVEENQAQDILISQDQQLELMRLVKERGIHHLTAKKHLKDNFFYENSSQIKADDYLKIYEHFRTFDFEQ